TFDVLSGHATIMQAMVPTPNVPRLSIVPATIDLMSFEREAGASGGRHYRLRDCLAAMTAAEEPDQAAAYILRDGPPSLSLPTVNALRAADAVLAPLQWAFFALEGLAQLLSTVDEIKVRLTPKLQIHAVVLTMSDTRTSLSDQVVDDVRRVLGEKVYTTVIPRNVRVAESPSHGKPVLLYDYRCLGTQPYIPLE